MNFLYLFVINVAMGLTLAIQVLIHPTFETSTKTMYLISAIVFVNWAVFTWLAYSAAMKEQKLSRGAKASAELPMDDADQRKKALLDVMTADIWRYLLSLTGLNGSSSRADQNCVCRGSLTAILLPLVLAHRQQEFGLSDRGALTWLHPGMDYVMECLSHIEGIDTRRMFENTRLETTDSFVCDDQVCSKCCRGARACSARTRRPVRLTQVRSSITSSKTLRTATKWRCYSARFSKTCLNQSPKDRAEER